MQKWEYKEISLSDINELGDDGWEPVMPTYSTWCGNGAIQVETILMKRPIEDIKQSHFDKQGNYLEIPDHDPYGTLLP